jgi:F-type H+-transporting ATPase subunit a
MFLGCNHLQGYAIMHVLDTFEQPIFKPLNFFGIDNDLFAINMKTMANTWVAIIVIVALITLCRIALRSKGSMGAHLVILFVESFMDLTAQAMGSFHYRYFSFVTAIFVFILACNWIIIIPGTAEPTKDLNTALACGIFSFFYKELETVRVHGFSGYIQEFLHPFFLMFPVNVIGHFSKIISISFRLFGNIFGGSIIMELYHQAIGLHPLLQVAGLFSGLNFGILLFFGLFEGFIQAFIFAMLTITYLALAVEQESPTAGE